MTVVSEVLSSRCVTCDSGHVTGEVMSLNALPRGCEAVIVGLDQQLTPATARRLADLGLTTGRCVELIRRAPLRDPLQFRVCDYELLLRSQEARHVLVRATA